MTQGAGLRLCFSIEKTGYRTCPGRYGKGKSMGEAFRMPDAPGGVVYRLRANEIHARHSEGSFLRLCDGRILYAYSLFSGSAGDDDPSNIAVVTSADEGTLTVTLGMLPGESTFVIGETAANCLLVVKRVIITYPNSGQRTWVLDPEMRMAFISTKRLK